MKTNRFATFAWGVLAYNVVVILWGAFVRATGSGAGCGSHWPLCNGEMVPRAPAIETMIELSHRLSSGLALIAVGILLVWAWRAYPKGHIVRLGAVLSTFFLLLEALIGAGLVLFEYVAFNVSVARAYWIAAHLINTFLLLGVLTLTAWWASGGTRLRWRNQGAVGWTLALAFGAMLGLGASGGITALGDTLVLQGGITPAESPIVAALLGIRLLHPILAFGVGGIVAATAWLVRAQRPSTQTSRYSTWLIALFVGQLLLGALNVALKAPVTIQLAHLLLSDLIWIALVLLAATALAQPAALMSEQDAKPGNFTLSPTRRM